MNLSKTKKNSFFKRTAMVVAIAISSMIFGAGCKSESVTELDCFKEMTVTGQYDSSIFYKNESYLWGGDSGCIYVSEEESEEYGGWFYQYMSEAGGLASFGIYGNGTYGACVAVFRSKDMNEWELCGAVDNGLAIHLPADSWREQYTWAPEVIYDEPSGKYVMYFSSASKVNDGSVPGAEYSSNTQNLYYRYYLGSAISDTPVGPFTLSTSKEYYGVEKPNLNGDIINTVNPPINFQKHFELDSEWCAIDAHPFVDDDGQLYLYFVRHVSPTYSGGNCVWVMKMKDAISPDYESMRKVTDVNGSSVEYIGGDVWEESSYRVLHEFDGKEVETDEGMVNEGTQVISHTSANGTKKYYMFYSPHGVGYWAYDALVAVADSPTGPFVKVPEEYGGRAMGVNASNDYMTNLGHIDLVPAGSETRVVHWLAPSPYSGVVDPGRIYGTTDMVWRYDENLGYEMPYINGPSVSLQPLPEVTTGYTNIADEATVKAKGKGKEYLNDGWYTTLDYVAECEYRQSEQVEITFNFDTFREIKAVMVYNSYYYDYAFSKVDKIEFQTESGRCQISDLPFDSSNYNSVDRFLRLGGSSFASFEPIKASSITITITKKLDSSAGQEIRVSDVVILGK